MIKLNNKTIGSAFLGSTPISKIYKGEQLVYNKSIELIGYDILHIKSTVKTNTNDLYNPALYEDANEVITRKVVKYKNYIYALQDSNSYKKLQYFNNTQLNNFINLDFNRHFSFLVHAYPTYTLYESFVKLSEFKIKSDEIIIE